MVFLFYFLIFFLGAVFASFAMVLGERLPQEKPVILSRSRCSSCQRELSWLDLAPIISWVALLGKCRYCGQKISWRYLAGETILGFLFVIVAVKYKLLTNIFAAKIDYFAVSQVIFVWLLATILMAIFLADWRYFTIPDKLLWFLALSLVVFWGVSYALNIYSSGFIIARVLSGAIFGGLFWCVWFFSQGKWLGFGDVKYFFVSGALLGLEGFLAMVFLASLAGSLVGMWQIAFLQKSLKSKLPFGVFLAPATIIIYVFFDYLSSFFLKLLII